MHPTDDLGERGQAIFDRLRAATSSPPTEPVSATSAADDERGAAPAVTGTASPAPAVTPTPTGGDEADPPASSREQGAATDAAPVASSDDRPAAEASSWATDIATERTAPPALTAPSSTETVDVADPDVTPSPAPGHDARPAEHRPAEPLGRPDDPPVAPVAPATAPPTTPPPVAAESAIAAPVAPAAEAPTTPPPVAAESAIAGPDVAPPAAAASDVAAPATSASDDAVESTGALAAPAAAPSPVASVVGESDRVVERAAEIADAAPPVLAPETEPPLGKARRPLPRVMAIANQKGGVGKTTTAVNLGAALAELGYRVLVCDLDPQGNATTGLGINPRNLEASIYDVIMHDTPLEDCIEPTSLRNLFVVPATIDLAGAEIELVPAFSRELKLRRALQSVSDDFDFVLIDCPPSLGLITVNGLAAATEVIVPIQCEYYALEGLGQLLRNVNLVQGNLNPQLEVSTIILTMYDARTKLSDQVASEVRLHFGDKVCRNIVPRTVRLSEAPSFGQPIIVFDPSSRGAIAYRELAKEVSGGAPQRVG